MIERGISRDENNTPHCEKCGSDLSVKDCVTLIEHLDELCTYSWVFKCNKCGARIELQFDR